MGMEHEGALKSNWMLSISGIKKVLAKYSGLTLVEITQLFRPRSLGRATWGGGGGGRLGGETSLKSCQTEMASVPSDRD